MIKKLIIGRKIGLGVQNSLQAETEILKQKFNYELYIVTQQKIIENLGTRRYVYSLGRFYFYLMSRLYYGLIFRLKAKNSHKIILRLTFGLDVHLLYWIFSKNEIFLEVHEKTNLRSVGGVLNHIIILCLIFSCLNIRFICVTKELQEFYTSIYKRKAIINANGVLINPAKEIIDRRFNKFKILFVSSTFNKYVGIDRLLEHLNNIAFTGELVLVGDTSNIRVDHSIRLNSYPFKITVFPGVDEEHLSFISSFCNIAVSSLDNDQSSLTEGSRLKVRGYLVRGLPVISNEMDIVLEPCQYFYRCKNAIEVEQTIKYLMSHEISKDEVFRSSANFIDKKEMMKALIEELC